MLYKRDDIFIIDVYILVIAIDHRPKKIEWDMIFCNCMQWLQRGVLDCISR